MSKLAAPPDYRELLALAKQADECARNMLCTHIRSHLWPILCLQLSGWQRHELEDILQSTLLTFCERLHKISDSPLSYAYMIMRNKIGNALHPPVSPGRLPQEGLAYVSEKRECASLEAAADESADPEVRAVHAETVERLVRALATLQSFCRIVFAGLVTGHSLKEIWDDLRRANPNLKRGTFDKRVFACRRRLREMISGEK